MVAGYGMWLVSRFCGQVGGKRESGENDLKSSSSLPLHVQRRRSCTVPFKTAPCRVFFFNKRKKFGSDPKMGYDSCPPLYNAYEAKTLRSKLVKKTKGKKMI
jgi:hypothetical protein